MTTSGEVDCIPVDCIDLLVVKTPLGPHVVVQLPIETVTCGGWRNRCVVFQLVVVFHYFRRFQLLPKRALPCQSYE